MEQISWTVESTFIKIFKEAFDSNLHMICNLHLAYADMIMKSAFYFYISLTPFFILKIFNFLS